MSLTFLGVRRRWTLLFSRTSPSDSCVTRFLLPLLVVLLASASWHKTVHAEPLRILMVGNSLTANSVRHVREFLNADIGEASVTAFTPGGETLFGHYTSPSTVATLTDTDWDVVILQGHGGVPAFASALPDPPVDITKASTDGQNREASYHSFWIGGRGLSDALMTANPDVNLLYFSTWPVHQRLYDSRPPSILVNPTIQQTHTNASYTSLSSEYPGSRVAPVGDAWLESYKQRPEFRLHSSDDIHALHRGGYLAGAVLYEMVTGRSSVNSGYTGGLSAVDARYLQGIATATTHVPEPSSLFLAEFGVVGLLSYFSRRNHRSLC